MALITTLIIGSILGTVAGAAVSGAVNYGMQKDQQGWSANENQLSREFTSSENQLNRDFNAEQAQLDRDFQKYMTENAYQMQVASMRDAGLNPATAANGSVFQNQSRAALGATGSTNANTLMAGGYQGMNMNIGSAILGGALTGLSMNKSMLLNQKVNNATSALESQKAFDIQNTQAMKNYINAINQTTNNDLTKIEANLKHNFNYHKLGELNNCNFEEFLQRINNNEPIKLTEKFTKYITNVALAQKMDYNKF